MYARRNRNGVTNRNCLPYLARTVQRMLFALHCIVTAIGIILRRCSMRGFWRIPDINHGFHRGLNTRIRSCPRCTAALVWIL